MRYQLGASSRKINHWLANRLFRYTFFSCSESKKQNHRRAANRPWIKNWIDFGFGNRLLIFKTFYNSYYPSKDVLECCRQVVYRSWPKLEVHDRIIKARMCCWYPLQIIHLMIISGQLIIENMIYLTELLKRRYPVCSPIFESIHLSSSEDWNGSRSTFEINVSWIL